MKLTKATDFEILSVKKVEVAFDAESTVNNFAFQNLSDLNLKITTSAVIDWFYRNSLLNFKTFDISIAMVTYMIPLKQMKPLLKKMKFCQISWYLH